MMVTAEEFLRRFRVQNLFFFDAGPYPQRARCAFCGEKGHPTLQGFADCANEIAQASELPTEVRIQ